MSISGLFLLLFLLVHLSANLTSLVSPELFNETCRFMGSNPFILAMIPVLSAGIIIHVLYAVKLTLYNLHARGPISYAVRNKSKAVSFASKNMFVLGVVILSGLALHLVHFWSKMQLKEITGGVEANPYDLLLYQFSQLQVVIIYLIWIVALWFHLTHGFWSAFHTIGLSNQKWIKRLQAIAYICATLIAIGFIVIPIYFYFLI